MMSLQRFPGLRLLLRGARASSEPVRLTQRRIFILPTRFGIFYGLLVGGALIGAVNYGNNLGYAVAFLLAALGAVSVMHTYRNLSGIIVLPGRVDDVFAGETASFKLRLQEDSGRRRHAILLRETGASTRTDIPPGERTVHTLAVPTEKRGIRSLGQVNIATTYPLGLVRAWSWTKPDMTCHVYPSPVRLPSDRHTGRPAQGQERDAAEQLGGSGDFKDLAEHTRGDSAKRIDWKALARGRGLLVKRFAAEEDTSVWFDFSDLAHLDRERALSILCGLILEAEEAGRPYGLRLTGQSFPPDLGAEHKKACLRGLALFPGTESSG